MSKTIWSPDSLSPRGPVYQAIADALGRDVRAGRLRVGDRLPTHRELARTLGVNVMTVTRAYQEAARRGLVGGEVGRGTFVRAGASAPRMTSRLEPDAGAEIDMEFNLPWGDPTLVDPEGTFGAIAREIATEALFGGYAAAGRMEHREAGAEWIERLGLGADPDRILVTSGAQHALAVAFTTVTRPGHTVLCEELTYPGIKALAGSLGLKLQGLPLDGEGIVPEAFEAACLRGGARALYVQPTLQNPMGSVMSEQRREEIADIAQRHGTWIVEDDVYRLEGSPGPAPLTRYLPQRSLYITSTSKSLVAGLRVGFLLAPTDPRNRGWFERLASSLSSLTWMAPPMMVEATARWIRSGQATDMAQAKLAEAEARRGIFDQMFPDQGSPSALHSPHVWWPLPEPWRGNDLAAEARRRGVALVPAESFMVGRGQAPHAVRLCLGTPSSRDDVERGLLVLKEVLEETPGGCRRVV